MPDVSFLQRITTLFRAAIFIVAFAMFLAIAVLFLPIFLLLRYTYGCILISNMWLKWCADGTSALVVYSNSPKWQVYFEERVIPKMPKSTIVLNWSERKRWPSWSLPVCVFSYFAGDDEYNPIVIVVKPFRFPRVFRFYQAFIDQKHGNSLALEMLEASLYSDLGLTEVA